MKKSLVLVAIAASLFATGCARQTFLINGNDGTVTENMQMFFVAGIGQGKTVDAADVCGSASQVAKVETEMTFLDSLIGSLSSGIVTPRTARVYCSQRTASTPE